jgi:ABC-type dipeptide/oligopeptide/nickel transport system permease component
MNRFLVRRFLYSILALIGATVLVFSLSRVVGDPRLVYAQEGGYGITEEQWELLGKKLGLDKPVIVQYGIWLGNTARGDLGNSLMDQRPVTQIVASRIGATLKLALVAWIFATVVGIPLGVLSAVKRSSFWDYLGRGFAIFGQTLPPFWIGIMGILIFAVKLGWLPSSYQYEEGLNLKSYVLPGLTLGWLAAAGYTRLTRSAMLEILDSEFIRLAKAKGVKSTLVIWKHGFRNAIIAPLTLSSLILGGFITGTVVVETVFSWPGLGRLAVEATIDNDFALMTGCVLLFTLMYVVVNFVTDVLYAYADPRIRYD